MVASTLTPLQQTVLAEFFRREAGFFLTGGAALAGFHLGHRTTQDLDLFTPDDRLDTAERVLAAIAADLGGAVEALTRAGDFRRWILRARNAAVVVDLVRDRVPALHREKPTVDGIRIDPADEILVNKLSALMSRSELRDLIDVRALEAAGFPVDTAMLEGTVKDASLTPAQLGWVLSQITIGESVRLPGGVSSSDVREYLAQLIARLGRMALPPKP